MPLTKSEITRLRSLREKKHRESLGLFVVEGPKVVAELLAAGYPFAELYATDAWVGPVGRVPSPQDHVSVGRVPSPGVNMTDEYTYPAIITPAEMARISHYPTPADVLAVGRINRTPLAGADLHTGLTLALDGIQDPGNVGTLLRIADWFGFARVLLSPDSADLFSQKVINASMGSFARVVVHPTPLAEALAGIDIPVLGCDLHGDDVHTVESISDAVVVVGSEGRGLSPAVDALITRRVTIPKFGGAESLNAAVAAGIVCAQLRHPAG